MSNRRLRHLQSNADEYAEALNRVLCDDWSVTKAARETGVSAAALRQLLVSHGSGGDQDRIDQAADDRLLAATHAIALLAAERLVERLEAQGDQLKTQELLKAYKSASELVALKRQWSKGGRPPVEESGVSALAALLQEGDIAITKRDPAKEAIDVSPE